MALCFLVRHAPYIEHSQIYTYQMTLNEVGEGSVWLKGVDTLLREVSVSSRTKTCTSWTQALLKCDKGVFFQSMSVFQSNSKHIGFLDVLDQFAAEHDITVEIVLFSFISVFQSLLNVWDQLQPEMKTRSK